jgi:hypothetical protein
LGALKLALGRGMRSVMGSTCVRKSRGMQSRACWLMCCYSVPQTAQRDAQNDALNLLHTSRGMQSQECQLSSGRLGALKLALGRGMRSVMGSTCVQTYT